MPSTPKLSFPVATPRDRTPPPKLCHQMIISPKYGYSPKP